ncbi:MAG TPA: hypothetical protein EYP98_03445 [Planctomycetes bacterium]|nr:hypothetical protein [Planctomycetota bacterium]
MGTLEAGVDEIGKRFLLLVEMAIPICEPRPKDHGYFCKARAIVVADLVYLLDKLCLKAI